MFPMPMVSKKLRQYYNDMKSVGLSHVSLATLITSDGQTVAAAGDGDISVSRCMIATTPDSN